MRAVSGMNYESVKRHRPAIYSFYVAQRRFVSIRKWPLDVNFHVTFLSVERNVNDPEYMHTPVNTFDLLLFHLLFKLLCYADDA